MLKLTRFAWIDPRHVHLFQTTTHLHAHLRTITSEIESFVDSTQLEPSQKEVLIQLVKGIEADKDREMDFRLKEKDRVFQRRLEELRDLKDAEMRRLESDLNCKLEKKSIELGRLCLFRIQKKHGKVPIEKVVGMPLY